MNHRPDLSYVANAFESAQNGEYNNVPFLVVNLKDSRHPNQDTGNGLEANQPLDAVYSIVIDILDDEYRAKKYFIEKFLLANKVGEQESIDHLKGVADAVLGLKIPHESIFRIAKNLQLVSNYSDGEYPSSDFDEIVFQSVIERVPIGFVAIKAVGLLDQEYSKVEADLIFPHFASPAKVLGYMKRAIRQNSRLV